MSLHAAVRGTAAIAFAVLGAACGSDLPSDPSPGQSGVPASVVRAFGDEQQAVASNRVLIQPTVVVRDRDGRPVAGATVTFTVTAGGGWVVEQTAATDATGHAGATWYLGPDPATPHRLEARAGNLATTFTAAATPINTGQTYFGTSEYIEYIAGDFPLIIAAPHGGTLTPSSIPDRTGNVTTVRDTNTEELAREIVTAFQSRTGRTPHVIICRLRRTKLDANREIVEAAQGNPFAERAWKEFHGFIEAARARVIADHGTGFFIDLHGHGHDIQRLELGYLLTASELAQPDDVLNSSPLVMKSSVRGLVTTGRSHAELLRGGTSLGASFHALGFPAVPSPAAHHPAGAPYFNGGYNTARYSSRDGGPVSSVQIETNFTGVRDTPASRRAFADAIVTIFASGWPPPASGFQLHSAWPGAERRLARPQPVFATQ